MRRNGGLGGHGHGHRRCHGVANILIHAVHAPDVIDEMLGVDVQLQWPRILCSGQVRRGVHHEAGAVAEEEHATG